MTVKHVFPNGLRGLMLQWKVVSQILVGGKALSFRPEGLFLADLRGLTLPTKKDGGRYDASSIVIGIDNLDEGLLALGRGIPAMTCGLMATRAHRNVTVHYAINEHRSEGGVNALCHFEENGRQTFLPLRTFDSIPEAMAACETWDPTRC